MPKYKLTSEEAAAIGRKGGEAGRGESKRRSPEHYQFLAQIRRNNAVARKRSLNIKKRRKKS